MMFLTVRFRVHSRTFHYIKVTRVYEVLCSVPHSNRDQGSYRTMYLGLEIYASAIRAGSPLSAGSMSSLRWDVIGGDLVGGDEGKKKVSVVC